jgi:hypothetical protein
MRRQIRVCAQFTCFLEVTLTYSINSDEAAAPLTGKLLKGTSIFCRSRCSRPVLPPETNRKRLGGPVLRRDLVPFYSAIYTAYRRRRLNPSGVRGAPNSGRFVQQSQRRSLHVPLNKNVRDICSHGSILSDYLWGYRVSSQLHSTDSRPWLKGGIKIKLMHLSQAANLC